MSHTIREKNKLLARVRRIRGQIEAVERALEAEIGCADVLQLIASVRGATNKRENPRASSARFNALPTRPRCPAMKTRSSTCTLTFP